MTIEAAAFRADAETMGWLKAHAERLGQDDQELLSRALTLAAEHYAGQSNALGEPLLSHCREVSSTLSRLGLDAETLAAGLVSALPSVNPGWVPLLQRTLGVGIATRVEGFVRMGQIQGLRSHSGEAKKSADRTAQLEAVRKMLLAMVQDVRVVLIKLADQLQTLRHLASRGEDFARRSAARDTFEVLAPLANRLGIWQLKWELEDLAFRCSDPVAYKQIARELDQKRADREAYIGRVTRMLRAELSKAELEGEVSGRPKHIYSIYKKLARKERSLDELFDIRGVRILVNDVKDCYTALSMVHDLWTPLPREFDDYIAKPKPNGYRSLHTAVIGPNHEALEVQIRTHEMHQHCEYGVAAHWLYKERVTGASGVEKKIVWLRQILDWKDALARGSELAGQFGAGPFEDSVFVLTPQGRVIDLPKGATPVDFAYHVHSDIGHRCRGARVDGEMVPLNHSLSNGQTVEIVTVKSGGPSRDWLNGELGYLHSTRAKAKVRQWFNNQNLETAIAQGRQLAERVLQRSGRTALSLEALAHRLGVEKGDELLALVGRGEITARQLQGALRDDLPDAAASTLAEDTQNAPPVPAPYAPKTLHRSGDVLVVGVDKLLTVLAKCCKPVPPDPITGFVTRGRGVSVHRRSCSNVPRLDCERLITAQWSRDAEQGRFLVDVAIDGSNHPNVMRDVLDVFTREKVTVVASTSHTRDLGARMLFTLEVSGAGQVQRLLSVICEMPAVSSARRL